MFYNVLGSGSKGNATLVVAKDTVILIDLGITLCRLKAGLAEINKTIADIDAAIFTHEHSDHLNGLKALSPKLMYGTNGTLPSTLSNKVEYYKSFKIKDVTITPFPISHDAKMPSGYVIECDNEKFTYLTDTGIFIEETLPLVKNPTYLMIESNHDIAMLMHTNRPLATKQRIRSEYGHLSNEDSAFAACKIIGPNTKDIILAHISEEANTPDMALEAYKEIFAYQGLDLNKYNLLCAPQWHSMIGGDYEN